MSEETTRPSDDVADLLNDETTNGGRSDSAHLIQHEIESSQKIFLPRGSAETRFAPPQYYYVASKSGVVPSWAVR